MMIKSRRNIIISLILLTTPLQASSSYLEQKFQGIDKQKFDSTCGIASMANILRKNYFVDKSEIELLSLIEIKPAYSFVDLSLIAKKFNITTSGVKITPQQLQQIHSPTILHINRLGHGHFVILKGVDNTWVQIEDPAFGWLNYTLSQFNKYWLHKDGLGRALIFLNHENMLINREKNFLKKLSIQ
uniref:Colicin V secretion/processing ATP-binding protein cvaB n=1 Tax=Erwinia amylovora ATCC BAA-2158 TaxID=889211 RepID=E5B1V8_ERWAM|nr:Colicin V secretion/processing ATP-binding protein cvaB [Erwinia amylovora ATCC BAA-2158]